MILPVPEGIDTPHNERVLAFVRDLSTHGDLWEALWNVLKHHRDVESFCPDPANFRYAVAYVGSRIFAFAVGMSNIYMLLDAESRSRALAAGARDDNVPDAGWVYIRMWDGDAIEARLGEFVDCAYRQAKQDTRGTG